MHGDAQAWFRARQIPFAKGSGEIALDGQVAPLPGALDVARACIEFHMLGGLIAESAEAKVRRQN
jgi:hypothetical protein